MIKTKADEFIAAHVEKYGLNGSNTKHNEPVFPEQSGSSILHFSKNNHFVWGYNGRSYQSRRSSTCMYYTDYLKQKSTGSVLSLDRSLVDIAEQLADDYSAWSSIYVVNRGRFEDYAMIEACKEAGTRFSQLVVAYMGENPNSRIAYRSSVPVEVIWVTREMLLDVATMVIPWLRTSSLDVIQDIAISRNIGYDDSLVYPSRMKFVNHNFDGLRTCGPANWALCDAEEDTALMRYSWFAEHTNISSITTNIATWSPELIASQLDHPELKYCLMGTDPDADLASELMWKSVCPEHFECTEKPCWWDELQEEVTEMHDGGKHNEQWFTPVNRLAERVGLESYTIGNYLNEYGHVDNR